MMFCAVYGCTSSTATVNDPSIQYYHFPKHAVIVQHWISACWRADPIDINNEQICSIHFDENCYTSEYKLIDYLGHYTRMLKYDAVPTLNLPNPHTSIVLKHKDDQDVSLTTTDVINTEDMKEIMVYEMQNVTTEPVDDSSTFASSSQSLKEFLVIRPQEQQQQQQLLNAQLQFDEQNQEKTAEETVDDEKYKHITNPQELQELKEKNETLRKQILQFEEVIGNIQRNIEEKGETLRKKDEEIKKLMHQYDRLSRRAMSLADQKNILSKVFSESQIKILTGKKKIYWSDDDMAIGYTIRNLSNKRCYMYLSKCLNIPLPALSSIKRWSTLKKNEFVQLEKQDDDQN